MQAWSGIFLTFIWIGISTGLYFKARTKREEEDLAKMFASEEFRWVDTVQVNENASIYNYSGYNNLAAYEGEIWRLANQYSFVNVENFGRTYENRTLRAVHINRNKSSNIVFINSLIHAREWIVGCVTMNIIHRLLSYNSKEVEMLLTKYHFIIIPVLNPDGFHYTHVKNRMWRKNREPTPDANCTGTDVNRNFPYGFGTFDHKPAAPCDEAYPGNKALSSKEAQAINRMFYKYRHTMRYYLDYHSYGNMWLNSYGAHNWLPKNELQLKRYRENAAKVLKDTLGTEFKIGNVYDTLYQANGIILDHVHYSITPICFTVEVGVSYDGFNPPDTRINTYVISQWRTFVSQLVLLKSELDSGQYFKDKIKNWRRTSMKKRNVKSDRSKNSKKDQGHE